MAHVLDFVAPLFVPATRPERFEKAAASGADAIILDLEDAVAPDEKLKARNNLRADFTHLPVLVRVNGTGTPWHDDDLAMVETLSIAGLVLPKAEFSSGLQDIAARSQPVVALIESAAGIATARQIGTLPGVERLAFGSIDFCADVGAAHTHTALLAARCELVLASRLAGILPPIDGVTASIDDCSAIADDARHALELGFGGKLAIHPRQIGPIRTGFRPDEADVEWAKKVAATAGGAVAIDGFMVDEPVRSRARAILKRA